MRFPLEAGALSRFTLPSCRPRHKDRKCSGKTAQNCPNHSHCASLSCLLEADVKLYKVQIRRLKDA